MTTTNGHLPDDDEKAPTALRCPRCGEADYDRLVWLDDERIRCATCGTVYDPERGQGAD